MEENLTLTFQHFYLNYYMDQSISKGILFLTLLLTLLGRVPNASAQSVCRGTDFWLAIPYNTSGNSNIEIKIVSDVATTGTITSPAGLSVSFSVSPGAPFATIVPSTYAIATNQTVGNWGIHIQSNATISAFAGTIGLGGGDAVNVYPTPGLGTNFRITGYYNLNPTTILVVSPSNGNVVTFTTPCATLAGSAANTPFSVTLNQGQTYMVRASCDLTGARVTSTAPLQVFSHSRCSQIPTGSSYCDCIWTSSLPTNYWNTQYALGPLGGRNNTDRYRITAMNNGTSVSVNGSVVTTLNAGQFYETVRTGGVYITASDYISVTQFAQSNSQSGSNGDPAMIQVLPTRMFQNWHRFSTLLHGQVTSHFLTIVTKSNSTGSVRLNGAPLAGWTTVPGSLYSYRNGSIAAGEYTLLGDSGMHAVLAGWGGVNSYATSTGGSQPVVILAANDMSLKGHYLPAQGNLLDGLIQNADPAGDWTLERSADAQTPDRLIPLQVSGEPVGFSYLDAQVEAPSIWYYRIRHRDMSGAETAGDWVAISASANGMQFSAFPNPFSDHIQADFVLAEAGIAHLELLDAMGRLVSELTVEGQAGQNTCKISGIDDSQAGGLYFLKLTANGTTLTQSLIHK